MGKKPSKLFFVATQIFVPTYALSKITAKENRQTLLSRYIPRLSFHPHEPIHRSRQLPLPPDTALSVQANRPDTLLNHRFTQSIAPLFPLVKRKGYRFYDRKSENILNILLIRPGIHAGPHPESGYRRPAFHRSASSNSDGSSGWEPIRRH